MTTERDAELSALLDSALAPLEASALRAELARDPALAMRLAQLAQVDAALRALPARQAPADLRARLQARLDAEVSAPPALGAIRGGMRARPSRRRAWLAGFSAAAAAAAAAIFVLVAGPSARRDDAVGPASGLAARRTSDAPASAAIADSTGDAPVHAPGGEAGLTASARPDSASPPSAGAPPNPATLAAAASAGAAADSSTSLASDSAPSAADPQGGGAAANVAAVANSDSLERTAELASAGAPGESAQPALWIEATDDEAAALGELEPADAGVVAVLDLLGALDALEAEAS